MRDGALKSRKVFVTGGTRGMGYAIGTLLAASGARVTVCGSTAKSVEACRVASRRAKLPIKAIQLDVADAEAGARAIAGIAPDGLDILVCCAGQAFRGGALETSAEQWDRCMDLNLRAPFLLSKAALPAMIARGSGLIVFVSSIWALTATARRVPYIVAKAALSSLTRALAMDVAEAGVRVNAVAPGYIDTEFLRRSLAEANPGADVGKMLVATAARHPLGRIGEPGDVAEAVLYLARADFVTGQTLVVDGGLTTSFPLSDFAKAPAARNASQGRTRKGT
jgi:NAD(P)-dependent dehydrogenase (short-subunit alcohol dehydrogenase family)